MTTTTTIGAALVVLLYLGLIVFGIVWAFGLLGLVLNGSRLAKAAAQWLEADSRARRGKPPSSLPETGPRKVGWFWRSLGAIPSEPNEQ
jgi:hypothetical protein